MKTIHSSYLAAAGASLVLAACQFTSGGSQSAASGPRVGGSDLGGKFRPNLRMSGQLLDHGPELGVDDEAGDDDVMELERCVIVGHVGRHLPDSTT